MEIPDILSVKSFCSAKECKKYIAHLQNIIYDTDEQAKVIIQGKEMKLPRKQAHFGNSAYRYAGIKTAPRSYDTAPFLEKLQDKVNDFILEQELISEKDTSLLNYAIVNCYRDGKDYIGYHSDDERDLNKEDGILICSVSFGATRDFLMKNKTTKKVHKYPLESGELFIIKGNTNREFKHSVPKRLKVNEPRYNVTFRCLIE
jgi:alkylated DNA repair dioxygenase AlkB